ncbi:MAG: right-handed parallel beta-helix repeat-containing protein, partial [Thermodesulfovibrionales bacterium]
MGYKNLHSVSAVFFFVLFLFIMCNPLMAQAVIIEGRVFNESGPMKGAKVYAYKTYEDIGTNTPVTVSGPADENGVYKLQLPEGEYYFTSSGSDNGREFFSYHGNNPIKLETENAWLTLMATEVKPPVYSDGVTSLRGVVTYKGKPLKDAYIALYTSENRRFKGLGFRTESIEEDGTFNLSLPPNKYVVIAKKMEADNKIRPLRNGDLFCYYPSNPVEIKSDRTAQIEVPCYPKGDRHSFVATENIKENKYPTVEDLTEKYKFGIRGRVTDIEGKPLEGVYVLAYRGNYDTVFMMFHVSHGTEYAGKTDKDGRYFIPVDSDGDFHVLARNTLGGSPHSEEIYGLYGGNPRHIVSFKKGEVVENINIVVGEAMVHEVAYKVKDTVKVDSIDYKTDYIIDRDTVWKGNIFITGTLWVKRGVTLIVEPGTVVKFRKLDRDDNGIGDGELIIEGRIIARGTKKDRIIFTSAEEKPEAKDWSYVLFLATGSDNVFEYCEFQYAFSGLQIHYSNAKVIDCLFDKNNEGLRYNRSNVVIEHNTFLDNEIGIRFVRLEGKATIRDN